MNDLIPFKVRGIGRVAIALIRLLSGVMVGKLSLLDNNKPTFDLKV